MHLDYGRTLDRKIATIDALYALYELLSFTKFSEIQFLKMLETKSKRELDQFILVWGKSHCISNLLYNQQALDRESLAILQNPKSSSPNNAIAKILSPHCINSLALRNVPIVISSMKAASRNCKTFNACSINALLIVEDDQHTCFSFEMDARCRIGRRRTLTQHLQLAASYAMLYDAVAEICDFVAVAPDHDLILGEGSSVSLLASSKWPWL